MSGPIVGLAIPHAFTANPREEVLEGAIHSQMKWWTGTKAVQLRLREPLFMPPGRHETRRDHRFDGR